MENKICTKCKVSKTISSFTIRCKRTGRLHTWCSLCLKEYKSVRWATKKVEMKEYKKIWYEKNKEDQKEKNRNRYHTGDKTKHSANVWKNKILRDFGITEVDYKSILESQQGVCKICRKKDDRRLAVDHCHVTGNIRGLLCRRCNTSIGLFEDNVNLLKYAIEYLEKSLMESTKNV